MPFALVVVGFLLIITGFQNTYQQFGSQVAKDFTGPGNFIYWIAAIGSVGALGYVPSLEKFSRVFITLIIVVIFLNKSNEGFFAALNSALKSGTTSKPLPAGGGSVNIGGSIDSSGGGGLDLSNIGTDVTLAETAAAFL